MSGKEQVEQLIEVLQAEAGDLLSVGADEPLRLFAGPYEVHVTDTNGLACAQVLEKVAEQAAAKAAERSVHLVNGENSEQALAASAVRLSEARENFSDAEREHEEIMEAVNNAETQEGDAQEGSTQDA